MPLAASWQDARNVLCVRLDALGDVLMTTPAIRALKQPAGRRITLLCSPAGAAIARLVPEIDRTIVYEAPWMKSTANPDRVADQKMIRTLERGHFDAAVVFTVYSQNPLPAAFTCYLAGIPLRLAYCHENPYHLLTDWVPDPEPQKEIRHECRRQLDLVANVGCVAAEEHMSMRVNKPARLAALAWLMEAGVNVDEPWVVVHPGCTAASRRYPAEHFAEVCRLLAMDQGWQIVFTGVREECALIESIQAMAGVETASLAGRLDLEQTAALLEIAPLLIANNTGPVHMAAALGTPVVDIYALTNPQHTPWQVPHRVVSHDVPCRYCYKSICPEGHHHCLRLISPDVVVRSAVDLMEEMRCARSMAEVVE